MTVLRIGRMVPVPLRRSLQRMRMRSWSGWVGDRMIDAIMAVLLIAGIGKLLDASAFRASLDSWELIPPDL